MEVLTLSGDVSLGKFKFKKVGKSIAKVAKKTTKVVTKSPVFQLAKVIAPFTPAAGAFQAMSMAKSNFKIVSKALKKPGSVSSESVANAINDLTDIPIIKNIPIAATLTAATAQNAEMNTAVDVQANISQQNAMAENNMTADSASLAPEREQVVDVEYPILQMTKLNGDMSSLSGDMNDENYVKKIQVALNKNGYKLAVDGFFGAGSRSALVSFQKKKGLAADGLSGPDTEKALGITQGLFARVEEEIKKTSPTDLLMMLNPITAIPVIENKAVRAATGDSIVDKVGKKVSPTYDSKKSLFDNLPKIGMKPKIIIAVVLLIVIFIIYKKAVK